MQSALDVAVWVCVVTFSLTALLTLLGVTGVLKVEKQYLDPLFKALILELVVIFVAAVGQRITRTVGDGQLKVKGDEFALVKLTFPIDRVALNAATETRQIQLGGAVYKLNADQELVGYAINRAGQIIPIPVNLALGDSNVFYGTLDYRQHPDTLLIRVGVMKKNARPVEDEFVVKDEVTNPIIGPSPSS